jgi:hypothetical protein
VCARVCAGCARSQALAHPEFRERYLGGSVAAQWRFAEMLVETALVMTELCIHQHEALRLLQEALEIATKLQPPSQQSQLVVEAKRTLVLVYQVGPLGALRAGLPFGAMLPRLHASRITLLPAALVFDGSPRFRPYCPPAPPPAPLRTWAASTTRSRC